jgi:hypothetical protein
MLNDLRRFLHGSTFGGPLRRAIRPLRPSWRRAQREAGYAHAAFLGEHASRIAAELKDMPTGRRALVLGYESPALAGFQAPLIFALRLAGFHVTVPLPDNVGAAADFYRALGANAILATDGLAAPPDGQVVQALFDATRSQAAMLALTYRNIPIGGFATSTLMRRCRLGSIDPRLPELAQKIKAAIGDSIRATDRALAMIEQVRPELVCFYDRGYTPDGELFEAALASGAHALTLNAAHRSGLVMSKRYDKANKDRHFGAPSAATWSKLCDMNWTEEHWQRLRTEVEDCYRSGTWYDEVGTQFGKSMPTRDEIVQHVGLDPARKTAVVFPHLFWDATFFWGEDLFDDYRDWFCHVLRTAARNNRVNWIIKLHPASIVKDRRDGFVGEAPEVVAMREVLGELPGHMIFLSPDSPVSTLALYELMDYCLTVRGTVGIEAGMYGKTVLTAGTGRYDGYGFTVDSRSREEYLGRLDEIEMLPALTAEQTELARRYAYGLFIQRPLEFQTMRFRYRHDEKATLELALDLPDNRSIRDMPDIARFAEWLAGTEEDLVGIMFADAVSG